MATLNFDDLIQRCNQGEFENIAQNGAAKCYEIDDQHVLVIATNTRYNNAKKVLEIIKGINRQSIPNVHTVLECKSDGKKTYELQSKAKGKTFKKMHTKQQVLDRLESYKVNREKFIKMGRKSQVLCEEQNIERLKRTMLTPEYASRIDTRKEELLKRYSLIMQMPLEHLTQYFKTILILSDNGIEVDTQGENVLYDSETGFNFIDLMWSFNNRRESFNHILDSDNFSTIQELLGTNRIVEVPEKEMPECIQAMRDALKKIVISVFDLEYGSQKMSREIIEQSLDTYREYDIDLTYEEIEQEVVNFKGVDSRLGEVSTQQTCVDAQKVGEGTAKEAGQVLEIEKTMETLYTHLKPKEKEQSKGVND